MSPTAKKKRKTSSTHADKTPTPTPTWTNQIPSLPYDLILNCIARVPRLYYPILSLVSKTFRSLLTSPDLYKLPSLLGRTESCLYLCFDSIPEPRWFTLSRKPDRMIANDTSTKKSSGYVLARVRIPKAPGKSREAAEFSGIVVDGSNIYTIGPRPLRSVTGDLDPIPVSRLDCWSHTWHEAPSLKAKLSWYSASVLDQKIYVAGWCSQGDSFENLIEVFDIRTQTWDPKPIPCSKPSRSPYDRTATVDGKLHVKYMSNYDEVVAYNSKEGRWDRAGEGMGRYMSRDSYCEVQNVLYSVHQEKISWYDTELRKWRELKGLVGLPKFPSDTRWIRLADYGGKLAVLWEEKPYYLNWIWCAKITLDKRNSCEIWGKVEWYEHMLISPASILKVLAVTV